jgi:hypothetical protein
LPRTSLLLTLKGPELAPQDVVRKLVQMEDSREDQN